MRLINKGFTLIELIISMLILGVIVAVASASYQGIIADQALTHQAEKIYYTLQLARTEAVKRNQKVYVHFCQQQQVWKMGISELASCDCFLANSCNLDDIEKVQTISDGNVLFINNGDVKFTGSQASYNTLRFSVNAGSITLSNSQQKSLSIVQSAMRLRICAPDEPQLGFPKC